VGRVLRLVSVGRVLRLVSVGRVLRLVSVGSLVSVGRVTGKDYVFSLSGLTPLKCKSREMYCTSVTETKLQIFTELGPKGQYLSCNS
jgi:hypothetical protein